MDMVMLSDREVPTENIDPLSVESQEGTDCLAFHYQKDGGDDMNNLCPLRLYSNDLLETEGTFQGYNQRIKLRICPRRRMSAQPDQDEA